MENQNIEDIEVTINNGDDIVITPAVSPITLTQADYLAQLQARRDDVALTIANAQNVIDSNTPILATIDAKIASVPPKE